MCSTRAARRRLKTLAALLPLTILLLAPAVRAEGPGDAWVSVRSPRYLFAGNAPAGDVRRAAARFELFTAAFFELFPAFGAHASVPTRVFVFKGYESFRPFRPRYDGETADFKGYFQSGADVNHICVPLALSNEDSRQVHSHEAVHPLRAPNRANMRFVLAQVHLRRGDSSAARESLERVAGGSANPRLRAMALGLLKGMAGK